MKKESDRKKRDKTIERTSDWHPLHGERLERLVFFLLDQKVTIILPHV